MQKDGGKARRRQRREVVLQPRAGDAENEHGENGADRHQHQLNGQVGRQPRRTDIDCDAGVDNPHSDQGQLHAQDARWEVGLPQAEADRSDDGGRRDGVDEGKAPGAARLRIGRGRPDVRRRAEGIVRGSARGCGAQLSSHTPACRPAAGRKPYSPLRTITFGHRIRLRRPHGPGEPEAAGYLADLAFGRWGMDRLSGGRRVA